MLRTPLKVKGCMYSMPLLWETKEKPQMQAAKKHKREHKYLEGFMLGRISFPQMTYLRENVGG